MENSFRKAVKELCDKVYQKSFQQITIDLVQENVEELTENQEVKRDDIGSTKYHVSCLLEVFNPEFKNDVELLTEINKALQEWENDYEETNKLLGLLPEE